jgi:hypothetical protein
MKMAIEWQEDCAKNWLATLTSQRDRIDRDVAAYQESRRQYERLLLQIETAKRKGKPGFDQEKFMKKVMNR